MQEERLGLDDAMSTGTSAGIRRSLGTACHSTRMPRYAHDDGAALAGRARRGCRAAALWRDNVVGERSEASRSFVRHVTCVSVPRLADSLRVGRRGRRTTVVSSSPLSSSWPSRISQSGWERARSASGRSAARLPRRQRPSGFRHGLRRPGACWARIGRRGRARHLGRQRVTARTAGEAGSRWGRPMGDPG